MIAFRAFDEIGAPRWDEVVAASPDGWAFSTSVWRRLILDVREWALEDLSFAACKGQRILGLMPLQYRAPTRSIASTGWGASGPVIARNVPRDERERVVSVLLKHADALGHQRGAQVFELAVTPVTRSALHAPWGVNPFVIHGFEDTSTQSRVVDLRQSVEALWSGLSHNARQMIRKAEKAGYRAERADWAERADDYYRVHVETYHRTGVPPHPQRYFEGIGRQLAACGFAVLWAGVAPDGRLVAFHNDSRFQGASSYFTGCSETDHLDSGVNYLLFWAAMVGAKQDGCEWYEVGEVFPAARDGKSRGLTVFKSKFGGELHRSFKARRMLEVAAPEPAAEVTTAAPPESDSAIRSAYQHGSTYDPSRICRRFDQAADHYADRLLQERFALVAEFYTGGLLVDLCCATGAHLVDIADGVDRAVGIDFSGRYLAQASELGARDRRKVSFVQADARRIPVASASVDFLYSFSSLYAIPRASEVVAEVGRVLRPGGRAVLDFGNKRSINVYCLRYYTEWPTVQPLTLAEIRDALARAGLETLRHRRFQFLPLWAGRPAWLWPLLHPVWKSVLKRRVRGRMLDEWVSSLPILRAFAFRHVIVCRKLA